MVGVVEGPMSRQSGTLFKESTHAFDNINRLSSDLPHFHISQISIKPMYHVTTVRIRGSRSQSKLQIASSGIRDF
jgi:hypothetical protein